MYNTLREIVKIMNRILLIIIIFIFHLINCSPPPNYSDGLFTIKNNKNYDIIFFSSEIHDVSGDVVPPSKSITESIMIWRTDKNKIITCIVTDLTNDIERDFNIYPNEETIWYIK